MAHIKGINIGSNNYLIEPMLYSAATTNDSGATYTTSFDTGFELITGVCVQVKFSVTNKYQATLNNQFIYYEGSKVSAGKIKVDHTYNIVYDGTNWNIIGDLYDENIFVDTTAGWRTKNTFIAPVGSIIIYTDHGTYTDNDTTITVPGIKISDGLAYAIDLPFVGDDVAASIRNDLTTHINDTVKHITSTERTFWNNKLNCDISGETLIFNRS